MNLDPTLILSILTNQEQTILALQEKCQKQQEHIQQLESQQAGENDDME